MGLVVIGIDEAGYGPLLGPLTVGFSAFGVANWSEGEPAPDLWRLLQSGVCRRATDKRGRVAIEDSKKLKLPNASTRRHPLTHLERGVLCALGVLGRSVESDASLLEHIGVRLGDQPWYAGVPIPMPQGSTRQQIAIAVNMLRGAIGSTGVELLDLRCEVIDEDRFNRIVDSEGTKAAATMSAIGALLRDAWKRWADGSRGSLRIVCDRQGGRIGYGPILSDAMPGVSVRTVEESSRGCRYELDSDSGRAIVLFVSEAESRHLPVALASMTAKLVRELAMQRFNRYWNARMPELKPTAGYRQDAWRWLGDAAGVVKPEERKAMIRRA